MYLVLNSIIQQHYIRCYGKICNKIHTNSCNLISFSISGGSLAEVFYSLSRINSKHEQFSSYNKCLAFTLVVFTPYINAKIANLIAKWEDDCDNDVIDAQELRRKKQCIKAYKIAKGIYDCCQVVQYVGYLSDRSKSHSILNRIIGQHLVYLSADTNLDWSWSDLFSLNFRKSAVLTGIVFPALELSAFFLQFVQWWQNETSHGSLTKLPNPEPPSANTSTTTVAKYRNICPICLQKWKIPTINRISGQVQP